MVLVDNDMLVDNVNIFAGQIRRCILLPFTLSRLRA